MKNSELTGIIKEFITPRLIEVKDLFFKSQGDVERMKGLAESNCAELKDIRSAIEKSNANSEKNAKDISELKTILSKISNQLKDVKEIAKNASGMDQIVDELNKSSESTRSDLQKISKKFEGSFTKISNDINGFKKSAEVNTAGINKNSDSIDKLSDLIDKLSHSIDKLLEDFSKLVKTFENLDTDDRINDTVKSIEAVASSLHKTMESNIFELAKVANKIIDNVTEDKQVLNNTVKQLSNLSELIDEGFANFSDVLDKNREILQKYVGDEIGKVSLDLKNTTEDRSKELQKVTNRIASSVSDDNRLLNDVTKHITKLMDAISESRNKLQAFMNSGFGGVSVSLQKAESGIDKNNHELQKVTKKVAGAIEKNREEMRHNFEDAFAHVLSGALHNLKKSKD